MVSYQFLPTPWSLLLLLKCQNGNYGVSSRSGMPLKTARGNSPANGSLGDACGASYNPIGRETRLARRSRLNATRTPRGSSSTSMAVCTETKDCFRSLTNCLGAYFMFDAITHRLISIPLSKHVNARVFCKPWNVLLPPPFLNLIPFSDKLSIGPGNKVPRSVTRRGVLLLPPGRRPANPTVKYHRRR